MLIMYATLVFGNEIDYFPADRRVVDFVIDNRRDADMALLEEWFHADYAISFFEELHAGRHFRHGMLSRIVQAYLFIAIAHFIERIRGDRISGYGGYCSGIMPALTGSGALTHESYRSHLRRPLERLFQSMGKSMVMHDFVSSIMDFSVSGWTLADVVAEAAKRTGVYVKDVRSRHVFEIIARRPDLDRFVADVQQKADGLTVGSFLNDTFAHTPEIRPDALRSDFASFPLDRSSKMLFSSCGRRWAPAEGAAALRDFYTDTMLKPLDMAGCTDVIRRSGEPLIFVGSAPAARYVFDGTGPATPPYQLFDVGFFG